MMFELGEENKEEPTPRTTRETTICTIDVLKLRNTKERRLGTSTAYRSTRRCGVQIYLTICR